MLFHMHRDVTRRGFLGTLAATMGTLLVSPKRANAAPEHPQPRPGINGDYVLKKKDLAKTPKLIPLFDSVREIPEIMDGIHCNCGCSDGVALYSLLSCFEAKGMARTCGVCQEEARLVVKLHKERKSLSQIRAAYDARFG